MKLENFKHYLSKTNLKIVKQELPKSKMKPEHENELLGFITIETMDKYLRKNSKQFEDFQTIFLRLVGPERTNADIWKNINVDANYHNKLISKNERPSRDKVLQIIIGLRCNLQEAEELLASVGYSFSTSFKDLIIKAHIENKDYDIFSINDLLKFYGEKPLFLDEA